MVRLAIELVLTGEGLSGRVRQDPAFSQVAYDALYFPTFQWFQNKEELDISRDKLLAEVISPPGWSGITLEGNDQDLLYASVRRLVSLISNPAKLKEEVAVAVNRKAMSAPANLIDAIPVNLTLLAQVTPPDIYKWRFDQFGNPFQPAKVSEIYTDEVRRAIRFAQGFADALAEFKNPEPAPEAAAAAKAS